MADTADQFDRVRAVADGEKEYLQGVIEFYQTVLTVNAALVGQAQNIEVQRLTEASYAQNEEIKKISAWAAIFFAPTLIGTIYGMNFDRMPELHWRLGYPSAVILMLLLSVALYVHVQAATMALRLESGLHFGRTSSWIWCPQFRTRTIEADESRVAAIMTKRPSGATSNARCEPGSNPPSNSCRGDSGRIVGPAGTTLTAIILEPLR